MMDGCKVKPTAGSQMRAIRTGPGGVLFELVEEAFLQALFRLFKCKDPPCLTLNVQVLVKGTF